MSAKHIATPLLEWYGDAHRTLPWRVPPGSNERPDPYRIWLSEIMSQQTTVAAVIPYFEAFARRWPTVSALAAAADGDVMAAWAGLGYYARARNLVACARVVAVDMGGVFPDTEAGLRGLPGVGAYTAAAIAAIAFDRRAVVVDGNVERVVARLFAVDRPLPAAKPKLRTLADSITPDRRPGDYAQAMMDLGALVCRPKAPACDRCPLTQICDAASSGVADGLPKRSPKAARPVRFANVYILRFDQRIMLLRRPPSGLLGGMLALPMSNFAAAAGAGGGFPGAPVSADWRQVPGDVRHMFTHFEFRMSVFIAESAKAEQPEAIWVDAARIRRSGLPTVFLKAAEAGLAAFQS